MRNFTFNQPKFFRLTFLIAFLVLTSYKASAQFYTKHYIAPAPWQYFSKANEIVIATNSTTTVNITLSKSDGTLEANLTAIKGTPAVYRFQLNASSLPMNALDTVLNAAGLIVTSTGPTSINLRNVASDDYFQGENNDANIKGNAALTSFGDAGVGVRFRVGYYRDGSLGSFGSFGDQRPIYSIMATVNNTSIKINNNVTTTLNAGQSYLFKAPMGTLVESSNPCVMNTSAAIDMPGGCGDGAFNQIPPEAVLGTEYFIERGTGNSTAEQTTVIATKDNTVVTVTGYTAAGILASTNTVTLALAGSFHTFVNGSGGTSFTASRVVADKRVVVYSGTAQNCEVDVSTIAPVSECGGSNFIETAKFRNYKLGTLDYFGYILLRSATEVVYVNGTNIETRSGVAPRYQIGATGWYIINFKNTQIGGPDFLSISSAAKLTVSIVQQDGGFSMAGFFSNFAAQPEDPTLTYIAGGGCTNNKAELTTPAGFAPYQWFFNGAAITGANSPTYTATKTGSYSVSSTLACGAQTQSRPVTVTLCTDLGITKTVDNTTPCIGSNVEFTVKVSNLGGNNVSGISVNDLLPAGYTYVSSTPSVGSYDSATGVWSIGDVDAGAVLTLKVIATVNSSGNYTNTASLPASVDTNTANNSASAAVNPKIPYLAITNPATVCAPFTVDLTTAAVTAGSMGTLTLSYWTNSSATTSYTTPTAAVAGTYYIKATSPEGCVFIKPVVVTNNPQPTTPEIYVSKNSAACTTAGSTNLRSTENASTYNGSTYLWSTGEITRTIIINTEGTYTLKIINSSGCASNSSASITVTFAPAPPSASAQTFCSSENKKVSNLSPSGSNIKWYDTNTSTAPLAGTTALTSKTYYVSQTSSNGCESTRTAVVVTVNSTSSAPVVLPQAFCAADNKTVNDLSPSGSTIKWYDTDSSTSPLAVTTPLTSKTYYVSQTANSCGESARTAVVVTINTVPSAPATSPQAFCVNDSKKVGDLSPSGSGIKWYSASTGGTLYDGSETLSTKNYYVSQSNSCGESPRVLVEVTVNTTIAPTASSQVFCLNDNKKVADLSPSGAGIKWYSASTGGTLYNGTETLSSTNYYVSQTTNSCESSRTLVSVTVNNTVAPTASSQAFCSADNKKVNDLSPSGSGIKWYNASTAGTLYTGTETLSSGNYYVTQTLNSCESSRTLVSVTVNPTPAAPSISAESSTTFCTGGSVVLTSSGGNSYLWSTGATTQSITVSTSGSYSVKVANASGCQSPSSALVSVTVNPAPSAPSAIAQVFCSVDNKKVNDLSPSGADIKWYNAINGGTVYAGNETLTNGIYYVSQTTNGCESPRTSVSVTINPTPAKPTINASGATTFCSGDSITLTSSSATGNVWSTGATTQSITVSTSGNYSVQVTALGCSGAVSDATSVTVKPKPADVVTNKTICSGDNYTWPVNNTIYNTNQGALKIVNDGCTADQILNLIVTPKPADVITNKTICSGETYKWLANGIDYTTTQNGFRIPHDGCTADEVLNLTVTPKPADVVTTKTICSGETYKWLANGIDYTTTQNGFRISHDGCTADKVLNLTVTPKPADVVTTQTICSGETYKWLANGIDYTTNQNGFRILHDGCTADEVLNLTVTPKPADVVMNKIICSGETYKWLANGIDYTTTQSGFRIPHDGCTADEVLNLTVTPKPADVVTIQTICLGETYKWSANGIDYTTTQNGLRIPHDGCTADEVLNLTVTPKPTDVVTAQTICSGETYKWLANGIDYTTTQNGFRIPHDGCTADEVLNLTVTPKPADVVMNKIICSGETYKWLANGIDYTTTQSGFRIPHDGCTADEVLNLTVTPKPADVVTTQTICSGETYKWSANGIDYTTTQNGFRIPHDSCTADEVLNLTVTPKPADVVTTQTICSGETYKWSANGIDYTTTQNGFRIPHDGCTADEVLNLTVTPKPADVVTTQTICSGEIYKWSANGIDYTTTQNGFRISHDGCTADEVLNLTVTPKPADVVMNKIICSGETYKWLANGIDYTTTQSGFRIPHDGCTADEVLNLAVTPKPADVVTTQTICSGETYKWLANGIDYTTTQNGFRIPHDGCTADEVLNLTVTPKPADVVTNKTICSGENYTWPANNIIYNTTQNGFRIPHDGCTADKVLNLAVTPKPADVVTTQTICSGETYKWLANGVDYTITQNGFRIPHDGCTADEVLNLTVTPKPADVVMNKTICSGENYTWPANNIIYNTTQNGFRIPHDGCTADEVLNLTVTPKPADVVTTKIICSGEIYKWLANGIDYTTTQNGFRIPHDGCTADEVLNLTVNTFAKPIVNAINQLTCASSVASVELSGLPTGTWTINPGNISGNTTTTTISGLLPGNTYNYTVTNSLGCESLASSDIIISDFICAEDDTPSSINGATGGTISTVFANDKINGSAFLSADVSVSTTTLPAGLTFNSDGTIIIAPNTAAGTHIITYTICKSANLAICDSATVEVIITAPIIDAVAETISPSINGSIGGTTEISLITNDTLNGSSAVIGTQAGQVKLTGLTVPTGLTLNADGTITVAAGTPIGNYEVEYSICEVNNPTNCDIAKSTISVTGAVLVLKDDLAASVVGVDHPINVLNVLINDTKNGQPIVSTEVSITETSPDPTGNIKLNSDGTIVLKANTPAGTYELTYQVCELNTTNCSTAAVKITVVAPKMTIIADSYCSNNVAYVSYNVAPDNFTPDNLLTIKWIDSANNVVATQTDLPLSGNILWPGTFVDNNGNGLDWPGWLLINGQWTKGADGFENTIPSVTMEFSLNTTVNVVVNYPVATATCNAKPTFTIKANDDEAGPINTNKEISTSLNIFNNDILNGVVLNATNVILTTVIPNPNLILNADGSVDLKPQTPSGTYELTYQICDALNLSNCSQAVVSIRVINSADPEPPITPLIPIILTNDTANVDGINGELEFINVLNNDLVKGLPVNISDIVFTNTSTSPYFEFNSDGTVNVKPNTPAGNYALTYQVCEKANPTNCNTATLNVFVEVPSIAIIKTASFNDENGDGVAEAGETITYKFKITNTGNVALGQIRIADPLPGVVVSGQAIDLEPNESNDTNFTAAYKITQNDINHGSVANQASVEGRSAKGIIVSDTSDQESNADDRPTVLALNGCQIKVFNAFSPNGDSKNARFYIQGLECYPDNTVEIYNRWGVLIYDTDHYDNEDRVFVGISQGRTTVKQSDGLPVGTYYYTLKYRDSASNQHELSGYLYINK